MEHNRADQIRIGRECPITSLECTVKNVVAQYEEKNAWCGGFLNACKEYYMRVAIVDADTLEILHMIYDERAGNQINNL
ncbi:hypothetical protein [Dysgonomonas termitidis]